MKTIYAFKKEGARILLPKNIWRNAEEMRADKPKKLDKTV